MQASDSVNKYTGMPNHPSEHAFIAAARAALCWEVRRKNKPT